jgi:hypothetical protein
MSELKAAQMAWSRKLSAWMDERRPWVRVELYKEVKALEAKVAELKKGKK